MSRLEEIINRVIPFTDNEGHFADTIQLDVDDYAYLIAHVARAEEYKKDIVDMRGKLHLSCPNCHEDCLGWIIDGVPCGDDW